MSTPPIEDRIPLRSIPDLRGIPVDDATGVHVGQVWGALAEADTGLLRYLDLQLDRRPRHVLVPIGHARLHERFGAPALRLRAALLEDLEAVPAFEADAHEVDDPFERTLLEAHGRAYHGEHYYAHPSFDHSGLYAGEHPIVPAGTLPPGRMLRPLSELPKFEVARGEPDIRGWALCGSGEGLLGRVVDLIVDVEDLKVRYVVLDTGADGADDARRVLVPVGFLEVFPASSEVHAAALWHDDLEGLPPYSGGVVERTDEESVRAALRERIAGRRRYQLPDFSPRALRASD